MGLDMEKMVSNPQLGTIVHGMSRHPENVWRC